MDDDNTQDTFITSLIAPARAFVERHSRFLFVSGTRTATFSRWGGYLEIFRQPITSITSITYTDDTGTTTAYTGFLVSIGDYSTRISPAIDGSFPTLGTGGLITVTYVGGALASTAEEYIIGKRAMLILIGHWFEYREASATGAISTEVDLTVKSLLEEISPVSAY